MQAELIAYLFLSRVLKKINEEINMEFDQQFAIVVQKKGSRSIEPLGAWLQLFKEKTIREIIAKFDRFY